MLPVSVGSAQFVTATATDPAGNTSEFSQVFPGPSLSIGNVAVTEGNAGTVNADFLVTLSIPTSQTVTVAFATADGSATTANNDYQATTGTLTFTPGTTSQTITVPVNGDTTVEGDKTFTVNLSNPQNAVIGTGTGTGTIQDDDASPTLAINNVSQSEGNSGATAITFTVTLSGATGLTITVNFATADSTATTADNDYQPNSGTLTFNPGDTSKTITVLVNGDTIFENDETFTVSLSNPQNATITTGTGTGTIQNDDAAPAADLKVEKTAAAPSVRAGDLLAYTFVVTNLSNASAADVVLSDTIPANMTFVSLAAPAGWTVQTPAAGATGTIVATLANLGPGEKATFQLSVHVAPDAAPTASINNTANVTAATEDPNPGNNSATAVVTVEAAPPVVREQRLMFKLVSRSAAFRNELGLFPVDSADGRIGNLLPGDPGYAAAALARRRVLFRRDDGAGTIRRLTLPAGAFFGLYLVQNGSSAEVVARNRSHSSHRRPQVFFSFTAANTDRFAHIRWLSARQFAFEDLTGGGDRDFNDLVARFSVAAR